MKKTPIDTKSTAYCISVTQWVDPSCTLDLPEESMREAIQYDSSTPGWCLRCPNEFARETLVIDAVTRFRRSMNGVYTQGAELESALGEYVEMLRQLLSNVDLDDREIVNDVLEDWKIECERDQNYRWSQSEW